MVGKSVQKWALIESRSVEHVPDDARHGSLRDQVPFWFMGNCNFFTLAIGFVGPSLGLDLLWTSVASAIGIFLGTVVMALHASQGPGLGLPQMIQSRAQFGFKGVILPLIASLATFVGFNIIDTVLLSDGLKNLYGTDKGTFNIALTICVGLIAFFGHNVIHRSFKLLFLFSIPVFVIFSLYAVFAGSGLTSASAGEFSWSAFAAQLAICAGYNVTFSPYVSDYTRYLPRDTSVAKLIGSVFLGASTSAIWLIALGAWMATRLGATDGLVALRDFADQIMQGSGLFVVVLSVLSLVAVMSMNAYSGMLTSITMLKSVSGGAPSSSLRWISILALMGIWSITAWMTTADAVGLLYAGMTGMLYLLVPWSAVNLIDYFVCRKGNYSLEDLANPQGQYGSWSGAGLISYCIGLLVTIPFANLPGLFVGSIADALDGIDIAWVVSFMASSGAYLILVRNKAPLDQTQPSP